MDEFNFNNMGDDEFRREFMKFLSNYKSGLDNFFKNDFNWMDHYKKRNNLNEDILKNILDNLNLQSGKDDDGEWEKRYWQSPDGLSHFSSFTRTSNYNPFNGQVNFNNENTNLDTIKLLESKLNKAIMDEKYEDAAKIRDLITSLKVDK